MRGPEVGDGVPRDLGGGVESAVDVQAHRAVVGVEGEGDVRPPSRGDRARARAPHLLGALRGDAERDPVRPRDEPRGRGAIVRGEALPEEGAIAVTDVGVVEQEHGHGHRERRLHRGEARERVVRDDQRVRSVHREDAVEHARARGVPERRERTHPRRRSVQATQRPRRGRVAKRPRPARASEQHEKTRRAEREEEATHPAGRAPAACVPAAREGRVRARDEIERRRGFFGRDDAVRAWRAR